LPVLVVDDRVLVREVPDVELGKPMAAFGIQPEAQVHDGVVRLQHARKAVRAGDMKVVPHVTLVGQVELRIPPEVGAQRMLVAQVGAVVEVRHIGQPLADIGGEEPPGGVIRYRYQMRVGVGGGSLE